MGNNYYEVPVLGKPLRRPSIFDMKLVNELKSLRNPNDDYEVVSGTTMCAIDFYEGQARLDGSFCDYTTDAKMDYLKSLQTRGIKNIEMESLALSAMTNHVGIRAASVCVTLLDRLEGDQISISKEVFKQWETRPQEFIARYIRRQLLVQKKNRLV